MGKLYYRIYFTIYRGLIWLGQKQETDMIRVNAFIIISIFTMLLSVGLLSFLIGMIGKSMIVHSEIQSIAFVLVILSANWYAIFKKKSIML